MSNNFYVCSLYVHVCVTVAVSVLNGVTYACLECRRLWVQIPPKTAHISSKMTALGRVLCCCFIVFWVSYRVALKLRLQTCR